VVCSNECAVRGSVVCSNECAVRGSVVCSNECAVRKTPYLDCDRLEQKLF